MINPRQGHKTKDKESTPTKQAEGTAAAGQTGK